MSTADTTTEAVANSSTDREPNRWAVLSLLSVAQLMVVLDATIVTIAIPSAQQALHFSTDSRQWIVTAYALAFGSLLLLGGRIGDLFGRKRVFVVGLNGQEVERAAHPVPPVTQHARRGGPGARIRRMQHAREQLLVDGILIL